MTTESAVGHLMAVMTGVFNGILRPPHCRMAPIPPEFYLSLLSGYGDVSHISTEPRHNDIGSRISGHPIGDDPNRFMDLLDALAATCVQKEMGETFFVSLAMDSDSTTLYVSSNKTVPATVTTYLRRIRGQLKQLHDVLEFDSATTTDNETSPNPNNTQPRTEGELELQKTIYEHTYLKLRRRFLKRVPAILKEYPSVMASLRTEGITTDDATVLDLVKKLLQWMETRLRQEKLPVGQDLVFMIKGIEAMSVDNRLKGVGDVNIVTRWDNLIRTSGFAFSICFHGSSLTFRYQVRCRPDQDIVSATVARETFHPSPPYLYHHTRCMVSPTLTIPQGKIPGSSCTSKSP